MSVKRFVGCARINPVSQQVFKTAAGGMAAVSAGIVAFFLTGNHKPESIITLIALSMLSLSIPLLIGGRIFYNLLDGFEYVSAKADRILESLLMCGLMTATSGYSILLALLSNVICWAFTAGIVVSGFAIWSLSKEMDNPQMIRRDDL